VNSLVDAAGIKPTNTSARAVLTARGVRFYVAGGLVDHPEGTGTAATYNYRHLLQLMAIKIRQREGYTLDIIRKELRDLTGDSLERKVATSLAPALGAGSYQAVSEDDEQPAVWRRVQVADGIELHVRDDGPAAHEDAVIAMRESIRAALGRNDIR
jgi:DNA-binding transcriptional MerR regulator